MGGAPADPQVSLPMRQQLQLTLQLRPPERLSQTPQLSQLWVPNPQTPREAINVSGFKLSSGVISHVATGHTDRAQFVGERSQ